MNRPISQIPFLILTTVLLLYPTTWTPAADADEQEEAVKALRKMGVTRIDQNELAPGKPVFRADVPVRKNADAAAREVGKFKSIRTLHFW